ncbi:MAG: FtsX-like permease family protein [Schleiferiaceae bacterium]|nr:FtsX-like permease family protein [Schleiferiaceae bacterium]
MNFAWFIARRILRSPQGARSITQPIVRISIGAIALGMVIMILALATGNGLRQAIRNKITSFGGDIQVLQYQPTPNLEQAPVLLSDSLLTQIQQEAEVAYLEPFARKAGLIQHEEQFMGAILKGVGPGQRWENFRPYLTAGRIPRFVADAYQDSILISESLAADLSLALGERFSMYFVRQDRPPLRRNFTVGGLYRTDFEDIDQNFILTDLKHTQRLNGWDRGQVGGYALQLRAGADAAAVAHRIRQLLPYQYDALSAAQLHPQLYQWLALFDLNIVLILGIIVAVATVNMSIALLILITERTLLIGTLKALGARNMLVQRVFLYKAAYLIGLGLAWGNAIGLGLAWLQSHYGFIKLDPRTYYVSEVSIALNPWHILALNVGTLLICLLCLLLPSFLVARIRPVKALRFE